MTMSLQSVALTVLVTLLLSSALSSASVIRSNGDATSGTRTVYQTPFGSSTVTVRKHSLSDGRSIPEVIVRADTNYDLGFAVGSTFRDRVQQGIATDTDLLEKIIPFSKTPNGTAVVALYMTNNRRLYESYFREMEGIADGANVSRDTIFLMNFRYEIELLIGNDKKVNPSLESCSDLLVIPADGRTMLLGHNEDADPIIAPGAFFQRSRIGNGTTFTAYTYPGLLPGNAYGFNDRGFFFSCNALFPIPVRVGGIGRYMSSRCLMEVGNIEEAKRCIFVDNRASGCTFHCGSISDNAMFSVETSPIATATHTMAPNGSFYHANSYILIKNQPAVPDESSDHRIARAAEMLPVSTIPQMYAVLGDTKDRDFPIFRNSAHPDDGVMTVSTALFDVENRRVSVFVLQNPLLDPKPLVVFDLLE